MRLLLDNKAVHSSAINIIRTLSISCGVSHKPNTWVASEVNISSVLYAQYWSSAASQLSK